jgi:hypothetical protein
VTINGTLNVGNTYGAANLMVINGLVLKGRGAGGRSHSG